MHNALCIHARKIYCFRGMKDEIILKFFAEKVRSIRDKRNLTQEQLAALADTGRNTISNIENEKFEPKLSTICRIMWALEISPNEFFPKSE